MQSHQFDSDQFRYLVPTAKLMVALGMDRAEARRRERDYNRRIKAAGLVVVNRGKKNKRGAQ